MVMVAVPPPLQCEVCVPLVSCPTCVWLWFYWSTALELMINRGSKKDITTSLGAYGVGCYAKRLHLPPFVQTCVLSCFGLRSSHVTLWSPTGETVDWIYPVLPMRRPRQAKYGSLLLACVIPALG